MSRMAQLHISTYSIRYCDPMPAYPNSLKYILTLLDINPLRERFYEDVGAVVPGAWPWVGGGGKNNGR
jgi:hypothetical protein